MRRTPLRWLRDHTDMRIALVGAIGLIVIVWLLAMARNLLMLHPQV